MRVALAIVVLLAGCAEGPMSEDPSDDQDDGGKEDSAGITLCDPLPAASKALCSQIPNNGWRTALKAELTKPYFEPLAREVAEARAIDAASSDPADNVYPLADDTFSALRRVSPGRVKIVIMGQDPYINPGEANGLSFSVSPGIAVPPSLRNIFAELTREAADPVLGDELPAGFDCPANGDLTSWARRGVLMINAILTVRDGTPGSHADFGWQSLTDAILRVVRDRNRDNPTAYLLWGAYAQAKEALILGHEGGLTPPANPEVAILKSPHPSPLTHGFVGNGHFAAANQFLVDRGRTAVDWSLPRPPTGTIPSHCN